MKTANHPKQAISATAIGFLMTLVYATWKTLECIATATDMPSSLGRFWGEYLRPLLNLLNESYPSVWLVAGLFIIVASIVLDRYWDRLRFLVTVGTDGAHPEQSKTDGDLDRPAIARPAPTIDVTKMQDQQIIENSKIAERDQARSELTELVERGRGLRDEYVRAVLNAHPHITSTKGVHPIVAAERAIVEFISDAEKLAKERHHGLYAKMIGAPDPGMSAIGPSHRSAAVAKLEQVLGLLAEHTTRYCD